MTKSNHTCGTLNNKSIAFYSLRVYIQCMATFRDLKSKMKRLDESKGNRLAFELARLIEARHLSIKELAEQVDLSYEQTRRLVNGSALPSREAIERICAILGADLKKMTTLLFAEKSQRVYGSDVVSEVTGKDPRFSELEPLLPQLTQEQFETLRALAEVMARRTRMNAPDAVNTAAEDAVVPAAHGSKAKYLRLAQASNSALKPHSEPTSEQLQAPVKAAQHATDVGPVAKAEK